MPMQNGVQFEGDWRPPKEKHNPSKMVAFIMRVFGIQNEHAANTVLLTLSIIFFAVAAFIMFSL